MRAAKIVQQQRSKTGNGPYPMHSRVTPPSHTPAGLGSPFQPHHLFLWRESKADSTRQQYHRRWAKAGAAVPHGTRAESFHSFSSCTSAKLSVNAGFVAQEDVRGARWCVPSTQHCAVLCSAPHSAACVVQNMPSSAVAAVSCTGLDLLFQSEKRYRAFPMSLFSGLYHHKHNTNNYKHLTSFSMSIWKHPDYRSSWEKYHHPDTASPILWDRALTYDASASHLALEIAVWLKGGFLFLSWEHKNTLQNPLWFFSPL